MTSLLVKATAILALAILGQIVVMRRASAATRHTVWVSALVALLVLPVASQLLPSWAFAVHVTTSSPRVVSTPSTIQSTAPPFEPAAPTSAPALSPALVAEQPRVQIGALVAWTYAIGVCVVMLYGLVSRWQLGRFIRRATSVDDEEWTRVLSECKRAIGISFRVALLKSRERNMPLASGTRRPAVVVPAIAETWDENRKRAVLLHELAHIARLDCLTDTITFIVCAVYWFHPGVWWIATRARIERELACDDRVITAGTEAREYASHLLEIAYSFAGRRAPALAVCMARPRQLEGRMLAALDAARNRRIPSVRIRIVSAAVVVVMLAALAAARPVLTADEPPPVSDPQWPRVSDTREVIHATRNAVQQDVKAIAHLPVDGLKQVRAAVRAAASAIGVPQENLPGTWEIRPTDNKGFVHLRIVELNSSSGTNVPIDQLEGLTSAQLTGAGGPVQFKVRRDAGTFTFEGVIRSGVGAGTFSFTADPSFPDAMVKRGFARPTSAEQYQMARHDIGFAFVDELTKQGYGKPQTSDLVRAGQHGVQATYVRDMAALGYRVGTLDALITLRDHGVTAQYVRELADNGYKGLSADAIREARDHGITPEFVRTMRDAGYGSLPMDQLVQARDHGVTPEYVRALGDAGYRNLPLDQVIKVRDHGVTTEYTQGMRQLGYTLAIEDLVRARDHGVTLEYVRAMSSLGYGGQPIDLLIRARDHGVTSDYAKDVKALGYDKMTLDDLMTLRDHGMTAERIRTANSRAGTRLPVDMLKSLAAGGMR